MAEEQKAIDDGEVVSPGIECFVKCTSNKIDVVKDDVRSLCLNFDIQVGENFVGKGNNLKINNLTPGEYAALCQAFGVAKIDDKTPFCASLMTASTKARQEAWSTRMTRKDAKTDPSQTDILEGDATKKQIKFINDLRANKINGDEIYQECLTELDIESVDTIDKDSASTLIKNLQALEDKPDAMKGATDEEIAEEKAKTEKFNKHLKDTDKKQKAEKKKSKK